MRSHTLKFDQGDLTIRITRYPSKEAGKEPEVDIDVELGESSRSFVWLNSERQLFFLKEAIGNYIEVFHLKKEDEDDGQDEE